MIAKRPEDECHFSAYGVIRDKITVQEDRWNDYRSQQLLAFSGAIVYPQDKLGHAHLLVDMQHVLHLMPSLPRVLAQVERAMKICRGNKNVISHIGSYVLCIVKYNLYLFVWFQMEKKGKIDPTNIDVHMP